MFSISLILYFNENIIKQIILYFRTSKPLPTRPEMQCWQQFRVQAYQCNL